MGKWKSLCSWNGCDISEHKIVNRSGYEFLIAQREAYHFAGNMNQLATHANGDVLAFLNDDLILDNGSLDKGCHASCKTFPRFALGRCYEHQMENFSMVEWLLTSTTPRITLPKD